TPGSNGEGGVIIVPPPGPVLEPPPMPKPEPKPDNSQLAPLPGVPTVNPSSVPNDGKLLDLPPPKLEDTPKPMNPAKVDFPLPNSEPKIPPPPDTFPKQLEPTMPAPKPMDSSYPNIQTSPPGTIPIPKPNTEPSITPVPDRSNNDLPPLP